MVLSQKRVSNRSSRLTWEILTRMKQLEVGQATTMYHAEVNPRPPRDLPHPFNRFLGSYMQSFYEPWSRNPSNTPLRELIESYVLVQYNALIDFDTASSNYYSTNWHGPPNSTYNLGGMLAAMPVLNLAIAMSASSPR